MIQISDQVERWGNVERVLVAMPEHERQRHWDMSTWGTVTDCGTIACAAGHCGLDPWFRERGFRLDFIGGDAKISDVIAFFGVEGSSRIFLNSARRTVETVIEEVQVHHRELQKMAALMASAKTPAVGEDWPEQGGIYAGARLGRDGAPDYFLILGPEHDGALTWSEANAWAASLDLAGHRDAVLPNPEQQQALFDRLRHLFQRDWYWSREQHALCSNRAWGQGFANGDQLNWLKGLKVRARAVRSLIIQ